jgi:hypothetical protein
MLLELGYALIAAGISGKANTLEIDDNLEGARHPP